MLSYLKAKGIPELLEIQVQTCQLLTLVPARTIASRRADSLSHRSTSKWLNNSMNSCLQVT